MLRILGLATALLIGASSVPAQTLYGITGGPPATSTVSEMAGPPGGPCAYPNFVGLPVFTTFVPFGCATVGGLPIAGILGDVAQSHVTDLVWATNGPFITAYTPAGVAVTSLPVPLPLTPLTGLGFNSAAGVLWMTDGVLVMGVLAPGPGCVGPPVVVAGPFPTPSPGVLTDIEWDPSTGTLFGCDVLGFVTNMTVAGALGPFGIFPVAGMCGLVPPLQGLAVDTATPSVFGVPLTLLITDGITIGKIMPPGGLAPPTFYFPLPCWPSPVPFLKGLACTLHGNTFGVGCNTMALGVPAISSTGNSTTPGVFGINLAGAPGGGLAWLLIDIVPQCPALAFKGCPLYAAPVFLFGPFAIPVAGGIALPAAIPPALPIGVGVYAQWVCTQPAGGFALTSGLEFTLGMP